MNLNNQVVYSSQKLRHQSRPSNELAFDWLSDPNEWDKEKFSNDMITFIEQTQGANAYPNMVLIGMLTHQIDLYVECSRQLALKGLVADYNKGMTIGPSLYFSMADKALNRVLQIMKELGITPSHRVGAVKSKSPEALEFEEFIAGS
jgi:phage terminase small subunit